MHLSNSLRSLHATAFPDKDVFALFMDKQSAYLTQKISDQNAALAVHESIDRKAPLYL